MTNRAQFNTRTADLTTDFGYEMAVKWFGQDVVDSLPKFIRGKNAGKPKGIYQWTKVDKGGWVSDMYAPNGGYVENRSGAIIERALYHRVSHQHGVSRGERIAKLDQGENLAQRQTQEIENRIDYYAKEASAISEDAASAANQLAHLKKAIPTRPDADQELLRSLVKDRQEDFAMYVEMEIAHTCEVIETRGGLR